MSAGKLTESQGKATTGDSLGRLEQLIQRAGEEISGLRKANGELKEQVATLEQQHESATDAQSRSSEQQQALEAKVDGLVEQLEELLAMTD